jgi:hypothetical protein
MATLDVAWEQKSNIRINRAKAYRADGIQALRRDNGEAAPTGRVWGPFAFLVRNYKYHVQFRTTTSGQSLAIQAWPYNHLFSFVFSSLNGSNTAYSTVLLLLPLMQAPSVYSFLDLVKYNIHDPNLCQVDDRTPRLNNTIVTTSYCS